MDCSLHTSPFIFAGVDLLLPLIGGILAVAFPFFCVIVVSLTCQIRTSIIKRLVTHYFFPSCLKTICFRCLEVTRDNQCFFGEKILR